MTDQEILQKFSQPDSRQYAFSILVRQYQQKVYWVIRRMVIDHDDANDLTQEVFIKIWQKLDEFQGNSKLYTWIYRIAVNDCLGFLRSKRRKFFLPIGDVEGELEQILDHSTHISGDEVQMKLQKAMLKLPEKQRLVFQMKYFDDLTYEDIAEVTTTSVGALKASYHHAVSKIEKELNLMQL